MPHWVDIRAAPEIGDGIELFPSRQKPTLILMLALLLLACGTVGLYPN